MPRLMVYAFASPVSVHLAPSESQSLHQARHWRGRTSEVAQSTIAGHQRADDVRGEVFLRVERGRSLRVTFRTTANALCRAVALVVDSVSDSQYFRGSGRDHAVTATATRAGGIVGRR